MAVVYEDLSQRLPLPPFIPPLSPIQAPGDRPFMRPSERAAFAEQDKNPFGDASGGTREASSSTGGAPAGERPNRLALAPRTKPAPEIVVTKEPAASPEKADLWKREPAPAPCPRRRSPWRWL